MHSTFRFVARCAHATVLLASAACTLGPVTGDVVEGATAGYRVAFSGWTDARATPVSTFVLGNPAANPLTGTYVAIGTNPSGSLATQIGSSPTPAYQWQVIANPLTAAQWPLGGVVRLRATMKYGGSSTAADLVSFDTYGPACVSQRLAAGDSWINAGDTCRSPYPNSYITLVSNAKTPEQTSFDKIHYLSWRGGVQGSTDLVSFNAQAPFAENYYTTIGAPETLKDFKSAYGFTAGTSPVRAVYYNHGDLGIARDMNCKSSTINGFPVTACYVSNYGRKTSGVPLAAGFGIDGVDPQTAIGQALGPPGLAPIPGPNNTNIPVATVAMVYDKSRAPDERVQFMVYDEKGFRSTVAPLDNTGLAAAAFPGVPSAANVAVPDNCLTCHGASSVYDPSAVGVSLVKKGRFLPFDPAGFEFSTTNLPFTAQPMLAKLKQLNAMVLLTEPTTSTAALIKGMYLSQGGPGGPNDPNASFSNTYLPDGWKSPAVASNSRAAEHLYNEVVKPYCRTCHVSRDAGSYDWDSYDAFVAAKVSIGLHVCVNNSTSPMPQAEQTQTRFWTSGARAHLLSALNLGGPCAP